MFAIDRAEGDDDQDGSGGGGAVSEPDRRFALTDLPAEHGAAQAVAAGAAAAAAAPAAAVPTLDGHLESLRRDAGLLG